MHAIFAQAVGFAAMTLNIGSYQLKNSRQLVLCRAFGDLIYIAHYLLLGAYSGCTTVAICAVNGLIYGCKGQAWAKAGASRAREKPLSLRKSSTSTS